MSATAVILAVFSPLLVSLLRRDSWSDTVVNLVAVLVVTVLYIFGQWLDSSLLWPLGEAFWTGLMAAYGAQQISYKFVLKGNTATRQLEAVGDRHEESAVDTSHHG